LTNRINTLVLTLTLACLGLTSRADAGYVPNQVLVQLQPGVDITAFNQAYNTMTIGTASSNSYLLGTPSGKNIPNLASQMSEKKKK